MVTAINFISTKVHSLQIDAIEDTTGVEGDFTIEFTPSFSAESEKSFLIKFRISLVSVDDPAPFRLSLEYDGFFTTLEPITEEFKDSAFTKVNAPAIVYPYLRSFVSTVTLNAGINSPLLSTFNFQHFYQQEQAEIAKKSS